ncbi:hypothetical protein LINPERPRIM_LOCUS25966 [Linum perenne]
MDFSITASMILSLLITLQFLSQINARPIATTPQADQGLDCRTQFKLHKEVCKRSYNLDFNLCLRTLKSDPKATTAADLKTLAGVVILTAKDQSLLLSRIFAELLHHGKGDGKWKSAMEMCAFNYKDAAIFFRPTGLGDVTKSLELHSALDDSHSCDEELEKKKVKIDGFVAAEIGKWRKFYAIAYGAVLYAEDVYGGTVG